MIFTAKNIQKFCPNKIRIKIASFLVPGAFIIFQNLALAQNPLLLETKQQVYSFGTDSWKEENTVTYSYDQNGRLINQTSKYPAPCTEDDCPDYTTSRFARKTENWNYNNDGNVISNSDETQWWFKDEFGSWNLMTTSISTSKTTYHVDSLMADNIIIRDYPPTYDGQTHFKVSTSQHFEYNNNRQQTLYVDKYETSNDDYTSGHLNITTWSYQDGLLKTENEIEREFTDGVTTYSSSNLITYFYNSAKKLEYSLSEYYDNYSITNTSKKTFFYDSQGQSIKEESLYWDFNKNEWLISSFNEHEYYLSGIIKKFVYSYHSDADTLLVITSSYDESGKQFLEITDQYDAYMVFLKEFSHSTYEWFNDKSYRVTGFTANNIYSYLYFTESTSDGKPSVLRIETENYLADSTFQSSSLTQTLYDYDDSGYLIKTSETRTVYDQDSLIATGCCGWLFEAETVYENRCDGAPITITREQHNYVTGTAGEFYPEPLITRQLNRHTNSICGGDENDPMAMALYPNPSSGTINISSDLLTQLNTSLKVVTIEGKLVKSIFSPVTKALTMDLTGLSPGVYIVRLENQESHEEKRVVLVP